MLIIIFIIMFVVTFNIGFVGSYIIRKRKAEQRNIAFANLPTKVLFDYAMVNPFYNSDYKVMRRVMTEEEATKLVVNKMLIDNGLIGYRKVES